MGIQWFPQFDRVLGIRESDSALCLGPTVTMTPSQMSVAANLTNVATLGANTFTGDQQLGSANTLSWNADAYLRRDAANIIAMRNSTAPQAFRVYNTYTDSSNYEQFNVVWSGNSLYLQTYGTGTGGNRDIRINPASGNIIADNANVFVNIAGKVLGYSAGAGGAVTQASSRTTGVTLNASAGAITLVSAAGSTTPATFTVTNSAVSALDTIQLSQKSGTDKYVLLVTAVSAGSFAITAYTTGGTTTEQPVINFSILRGAVT